MTDANGNVPISRNSIDPLVPPLAPSQQKDQGPYTTQQNTPQLPQTQAQTHVPVPNQAHAQAQAPVPSRIPHQPQAPPQAPMPHQAHTQAQQGSVVHPQAQTYSQVPAQVPASHQPQTSAQVQQGSIVHPQVQTQQQATYNTPITPHSQPFQYASSQHNHSQDQYTQIPYFSTLPTQPKKSNGSKGLAFLVGLLGVFVGAALSVGVLYVATSGFSFSGSVDTSNIVIEPSSEDVELAEAVAAKVLPSVVNIDVFAAQESSILDGLFGDENSSSDSSSTEQTGLGSGVVLTSDGYIITNYHVVEGGEHFLVSIGEEQYEATMVGNDPRSDLAVIKVEVEGLTPIEIGDSDDVDVGEWVMAAGSPFGLEKSVSTGIVSALYRSTAMQSQSGLSIYANLIQTDAAINPGNSGGALVNSAGELIGINTLISSTSGSSSGVGFAIPINYAFKVAEQIINGEEVKHPYIGVNLYSVDASVAEELELSVESGAYIESVVPNSPAEEAGIQAGDVVIAANGQKVSTSAELIIQIREYEIGSAVNLEINRNGEVLEISVILGATSGQ